MSARLNFPSTGFDTETWFAEQQVVAEGVLKIIEMSNAEVDFKESLRVVNQKLKDRIAELSTRLQINIPWLGKSVSAKAAIPLFWSKYNEILRIKDSIERANAIIEYEDIRDEQFLPALKRVKEINESYDQLDSLREHPEVRGSLKGLQRSIQEYLGYAEDKSHFFDLFGARRFAGPHSKAMEIIHRFHSPNVGSIVQIQSVYRGYQERKSIVLKKLESIIADLNIFSALSDEYDDLNKQLDELESEEVAVTNEDGGGNTLSERADAVDDAMAETKKKIDDGLDHISRKYSEAFLKEDPDISELYETARETYSFLFHQ